jgi:hypothetical protein
MQLEGSIYGYTTINTNPKKERETFKEDAIRMTTQTTPAINLLWYALVVIVLTVLLGEGSFSYGLPVARISNPVKSTVVKPKPSVSPKATNSVIQADLKAATVASVPLQPTLLVLTPSLGQIDKTKALSNTADFLAKDLANALRIRLHKHQVLAYTDAVSVWQKQKIYSKAVDLTKKHTQGELLGTGEWSVLASSLKSIVPGATIDRLVMVEAEVDFTKPYQPHTKKQNFLHWLTEVKPTDALDVWLVNVTVYNMASQPYEPMYRWQYRTTLPADRLTTVFPQAELNRSTVPWLVQASRQVETAFLRETPFEVLNDEWAAINTAAGWKKSYKHRSIPDFGNAVLKEVTDIPTR